MTTDKKKFTPGLLLLMLFTGIPAAWAGEPTIPVQTIMLEAANQGLDGQIAVGEVIRNRAKRGDLSHDSVCLAPRQFSAWNDRKRARKWLSGADGKAYQSAAKAWELSEESSLTNGATHYHTVSVSPYWAKGKKGKRIGDHIFYRGIV
jgi:spore germination cell wall hydrolase CwlJ-like protein